MNGCGKLKVVSGGRVAGGLGVDLYCRLSTFYSLAAPASVAVPPGIEPRTDL